jgi:hypothetical protein
MTTDTKYSKQCDYIFSEKLTKYIQMMFYSQDSSAENWILNDLDFYSDSSLKQQPADRHIAPLWHIMLIQSQPVANSLILCVYQRSSKCIFHKLLLWCDKSWNPCSTIVKVCTLTISPQIQFSSAIRHVLPE